MPRLGRRVHYPIIFIIIFIIVSVIIRTIIIIIIRTIGIVGLILLISESKNTLLSLAILLAVLSSFSLVSRLSIISLWP